MYWSHQTLLRKSDRTLWILDPFYEGGSIWDWGSAAIGNSSGDIVEPDYKDLTHVEDEFGNAVPGTPVKCKSHPIHNKPYLKPDMSLMQYVTMSDDEKEKKRQVAINAYMQQFEIDLAKKQNGFIGFNVPWKQRPYLLERLTDRASHVFELGLDRKKIYVFDGIPYIHEETTFERLLELQVDQLEAFVGFLKSTNYRPR